MFGFTCKRNWGRNKEDAIHCIFSWVKLPMFYYRAVKFVFWF